MFLSDEESTLETLDLAVYQPFYISIYAAHHVYFKIH